MILVTGRNYAGKTTIKNKLARKIGLKNATIFTTRKKTPQDMIRTNYRFVSIIAFSHAKIFFFSLKVISEYSESNNIDSYTLFILFSAVENIGS